VFYLLCDFQKQQNTFRVYWLWFIFLFFRFVLRKAAADNVDYQIALSKEIIFPFGIGSKRTSLRNYQQKKNVSEYVIDKTAVIKVGPEYVWI
jgi:hypothetical protein